jgi:hypothetical protein
MPTRRAFNGFNRQPCESPSFHGNLTMLQIRNKCRAAGTGRDPWRVLFRLPETNHHGWAAGELVIFSRIMI